MTCARHSYDSSTVLVCHVLSHPFIFVQVTSKRHKYDILGKDDEDKVRCRKFILVARKVRSHRVALSRDSFEWSASHDETFLILMI